MNTLKLLKSKEKVNNQYKYFFDKFNLTLESNKRNNKKDFTIYFSMRQEAITRVIDSLVNLGFIVTRGFNHQILKSFLKIKSI